MAAGAALALDPKQSLQPQQQPQFLLPPVVARMTGLRTFDELLVKGGLYDRKIIKVCRQYISDPMAVEDVAQQARTTLFLNASTFRGESQFTTWLHSLVRAEVGMYHRRMSAQKNRIISFAHELEDRSLGDPNLEGALARIFLQRILPEMPPGYRNVFLMHEVYGYEHNEIAEALGITQGGSKSQLYKARKWIKKRLGRKV